jgi:hypothetical protein
MLDAEPCSYTKQAKPNKQRVGNEETEHDSSASWSVTSLASVRRADILRQPARHSPMAPNGFRDVSGLNLHTTHFRGHASPPAASSSHATKAPGTGTALRPLTASYSTTVPPRFTVFVPAGVQRIELPQDVRSVVQLWALVMMPATTSGISPSYPCALHHVQRVLQATGHKTMASAPF